MGATNNIKPNVFGSSPEKCSDSENTIPIRPVKDPDSTLATVVQTRLYDTKVQIKFNRLLLMAQDDEVSGTYPLNRELTYVGRSRKSHVRINDPLVSSRHLGVSVSGDTCVVNDLDSSNGTFINAERLVGSRVLKDGDEIVLGKTVVRFASRQAAAPVLPGRKTRGVVVPFYKKRLYRQVAIALGLVMAAASAYLGIYLASGHFANKAPLLADERQYSSRPTSIESAAASQPLVETTHIQRALGDYAAGRLDSARQTLKMLSTAKEFSPDALAANRLLSNISTVQELYDQAMRAEEQKKFAKALEHWDRLLGVDMELVGDRPSLFARQAEQRVQILSIEYALEALRSKNYMKAKQLCQLVLQINPENPEALALLSKIDPKA